MDTRTRRNFLVGFNKVFKQITIVFLLALLFSNFQICKGQENVTSRNNGQCPKKILQVDFCPVSEKAWFEAAARKNCSKDPNCNYTYHCLLNHWENTTYELCENNRGIIGYRCPEFNELGRKVQRSYKHFCKDCVFRYLSGEVYKYPECLSPSARFDKTSQTFNTVKLVTTKTTSISMEETSTSDLSFKIALPLVMLLILSICFGLIYETNRRRREQRKSTLPETMELVRVQRSPQ